MIQLKNENTIENKVYVKIVQNTRIDGTVAKDEYK